jgi:hypothetical protein
MDIIYLRFPLCAFLPQRKEKRKILKESDKERNEKGIEGVRGGREDEAEKTERKKRRITGKYYGKIRRIKLSVD